MNWEKTYHASRPKPGRPISITFHTREAEEAASARARELGLTMQELIDKVLNGEFDEPGGR